MIISEVVKIFDNEEGAVLVLSIIMISVLVILSTVLATSINNNISFTKNHENRVKSFYAAEGGIEYAYTVFSDNENWEKKNPNSNGQLDEYGVVSTLKSSTLNSLYNNYNIELEYLDREFINPADTPENKKAVRFKAKGISNEVNKTIETFNYYGLSVDYSNAITSGENITLKNNSLIDGDVDVGGTVSLGNNSVHNGSAINNIDWENWPEESAFDFGELKNLAGSNIFTPNNTNNNKPQGIDEVISPSNYDLGNNVTYIEGDIKLNQDINGNGILIVDGNLSIGNNIGVNSDNNQQFLIFTTGNIDIDQGNKFNYKGLIYSDKNIAIKNKFNLTGTIISKKSFEAKNTATLTYDTDFLETFLKWNLDFPEEEGSKLEKVITKSYDWKEY